VVICCDQLGKVLCRILTENKKKPNFFKFINYSNRYGIVVSNDACRVYNLTADITMTYLQQYCTRIMNTPVSCQFYLSPEQYTNSVRILNYGDSTKTFGSFSRTLTDNNKEEIIKWGLPQPFWTTLLYSTLDLFKNPHISQLDKTEQLIQRFLARNKSNKNHIIFSIGNIGLIVEKNKIYFYDNVTPQLMNNYTRIIDNNKAYIPQSFFGILEYNLTNKLLEFNSHTSIARNPIVNAVRVYDKITSKYSFKSAITFLANRKRNPIIHPFWVQLLLEMLLW